MKFLIVLIYLNFVKLIKTERIECNKKYFDSVNSFVCVCNSTYCDTIESVDFNEKENFYQEFITSKTKFRLDKFKFKFQPKFPEQSDLVIKLNRNKTFQRIKGFGGAITDATGYNIFSLSEQAISNLVNSYFGESGIDYNIIRVPLAGVDFSLREYSYDDSKDDFELKNFSLSMEDIKWKIPFIKKALKSSKKEILFFGSAWTAPAWMKTNNDFKGNGTLIGPLGGKYYEIWSNYYLKFLQAYKEENITFWALTAQNEPSDGYLYRFSFNCMGFTPQSQAVFVSQNLGPTLEKNGFEDVKILILDDQRIFLPEWAIEVLSYSKNVSKYVAGIAVHWYMDFFVPPNLLDKTNELYPDKFIFGSEACAGAGPLQPHVIMGGYNRAENYAKYIIQDLNHWVTGWTDWNMALDLNGGPNWSNNFVDSPIIVDNKKDEFYKQPMFYSMGHFSKFIPEGSVRIELVSDVQLSQIYFVAFYEENSKQTTLILLNEGEKDHSISIYDSGIGKSINLQSEAHSIRTIVWFNN